MSTFAGHRFSFRRRHRILIAASVAVALVASVVIALVASGTNSDAAALPGTNLALGRPATGSTPCRSSQSAAKAVNGSWSGSRDKWCSRAATKVLTVDLGTATALSSIVVRHAGAGGESARYNTRDFDLTASADGNEFTPVANVKDNRANVTTHPTTSTARFVRITVLRGEQYDSGGAARIYEFEVYGASAAPPSPSPSPSRSASASASASSSPSPSSTTSSPKPGLQSYTENFDAFDTNLWSCEYSCPTVSSGAAKFQLQAGIAPDRDGSWSKARYKPRRFTSGRFTVRFSLTTRPKQEMWWGAALWDTGPNPDESLCNEINFGYTTNQSFTNTQMLFESAKDGKFASIKVDTGVDLYDGAYHTAVLEYDSTHVSLYFDGKLLKTITDTSVIPTAPMGFVLGPRLVTGSSPLSSNFTETVDWAKIEW